MALPSFAKHTLTITRAPLITARGAQVRDWENATTHSVNGCVVRLASTSSSTGDARVNATTARLIALCPEDADIEAGDKVAFRGTEYAIDGVPFVVDSPTGAVTHMRVTLIDWEG